MSGMAGVKILTRADIANLSAIKGSQEILDYTLYDTLNVPTAGAPTSYRFFQQAAGQNGLTKRQTNMLIAGQLPNGYAMVVEDILLDPNFAALATTSLADLIAVTHQGSFEFYLNDRVYREGFVKDLVGGSLWGFGTGVVGTADASYAAARAVKTVKPSYGYVISSNISFAMQITYDVAPVVTSVVNMRVKLVGKLIRPVQG